MSLEQRSFVFEQYPQEVIDTLRLETQFQTPSEKAQFTKLVRDCNSALVEEYGNFMSETNKNLKCEDRFLLMGEPIYNLFNDLWPGYYKTVTSYTRPDDRGLMRTFNQGQFVISYPFSIWNKVPLKNKLSIAYKHKGWISAKTNVENNFMRHCILHELAHMHQDFTLPSLPFMETGASFYAGSITKKMGFSISYRSHNAAVDFHQQLISKFGVDVNHLYFGTLSDEEKRQKILSEFSPEVVRNIFPDFGVYNLKENT